MTSAVVKPPPINSENVVLYMALLIDTTSLRTVLSALVEVCHGNMGYPKVQTASEQLVAEQWQAIARRLTEAETEAATYGL